MSIVNLENGVDRFQKMIRAINPASNKYILDRYFDLANTLLYHILKREDLCVLPSLDEEGKFSYSTKPNQSDAQRTKTTLPRIVRRRFNLGTAWISDHKLAGFSEFIYPFIWDTGNNIKIARGREIIDVYKRYVHCSCMSGLSEEESVHLLQFYADNPETIGLLYRESKDETDNILGKALLWTDTEGNNIVDRMYYEEYHVAMEMLCKARSIGARVAKNLYSPLTAEDIGGSKFKVRVGENLTGLPYFDSMTFLEWIGTETMLMGVGGVAAKEVDGNAIGRCEDCSSVIVYDQSVGLCEWCGEVESPSMVKCFECNSSVEEGDVWNGPTGEGYCRDCWRNLFVSCRCCECTMTKEEATEVEGEHLCSVCVESSTAKCFMCENLFYDSIFSGNNIEAGDDGNRYCSECLENMGVERCYNCNMYVVTNGNNCENCDAVLVEESEVI